MRTALTVIGHGESLVERAGELLLGAASPENCIVVFPGKRPGHFLRKYLAEKKGSALRAPVITSMDGFMDLAAAELGVKGREASPLDLAEVLYGRLRKELCGVISLGPEELSLDSFLPWAYKITGDFEELKIELKTAGDLAAYDSLLPEDLRTGPVIRKLESFSRLYGDFYAELEKEGLLTRAVKYSRVAAGIEDLDAAKYENIVFAGFFALTASEKAVIKHLASRGARVLLQPGPGLEEQFGFLGPVEQPRPARRPRLRFYKAPDMHGEIFRLAQALKDPGPSDVIVLPEPRTLFPLLENALPDADYNVSMGYPLSATPVYALLDALGDLLDKKAEAGYFAPDYLKFVFHPYVKNLLLDGAAEPGRVIFQAVGETLAGRMDKYVSLAEIEGDEATLRTASGRLQEYGKKIGPAEVKAHLAGVHRTLLKPFEEIKDLGDFAAKLQDFISHISAHSTAPLHPYWGPFVEKALESVQELKACRLAGERFGGAAGYFKFFKTFMQGASYPFPGTPLKGLQVLGFLETRGLKFGRVYFLDANADVLPAARKEDSVLSHFVREGLKLSTYKTRERLSRYYFGALVAGASEAHIFYKDSADKERSPFVEELIWDLERRGEKPAEDEVHLRVSFSQKDPEPVGKTAALAAALKAREFSPSAINTYLACGLRFYYQYGLGLKEAGEIGEELDQRDIGIIVHDALEAFFKTKAGGPLNILETDYARAREAAGAVFRARLGRDTGFEYLIKRQVERRLDDILDYHRDNLQGIKILDCEPVLKAEIATRFGRVKLGGRADRVDDRAGVIHVVDYKTGSSASVPSAGFAPAARADWPATLKSVQLPFYILAYMAEHGLNPEGMDASLMLLGREKIEEATLYGAGNKAPRAALFAGYKDAIQTLLEEILDPDLPFSPPPDETPCGGCPFKNLCGRQWVDA